MLLILVVGLSALSMLRLPKYAQAKRAEYLAKLERFDQQQIYPAGHEGSP
ncbi:hypothetical protein [Streptomyces litchfieldiae]|uniref:Uncharacterized protein n=1 Tax=Streptomyces litchfieldiae TaxID=3075543 RepID=A0ABU2MNT9_9ACTN|nr:hypothetical protein [Streptomyces sp. DSM 44938]MDT0343225.1 hypothetical protein [Streptomyces sp. DSM 44938]